MFSPFLSPHLSIWHSTKDDGNQSFSWDDALRVSENQHRFFSQCRLNRSQAVFLELTHGTTIHTINKETLFEKNEHHQSFLIGDAVVTDRPELPLALTTGDCIPMVVFDQIKRAVALVHLGWRNVDAGLPKLVLHTLITAYGSQVEDLLVYLGPAIHAHSYTRPPEALEQRDRKAWQPFLSARDQLTEVDIIGYTKAQLRDAGVLPESLFESGINTAEDERFFSHNQATRHGSQNGRFMTLVCIR